MIPLYVVESHSINIAAILILINFQIEVAGRMGHFQGARYGGCTSSAGLPRRLHAAFRHLGQQFPFCCSQLVRHVVAFGVRKAGFDGRRWRTSTLPLAPGSGG